MSVCKRFGHHGNQNSIPISENASVCLPVMPILLWKFDVNLFLTVETIPLQAIANWPSPDHQQTRLSLSAHNWQISLVARSM